MKGLINFKNSVLMLLLFFAGQMTAQNLQQREQLESAKVAFITNRLSLTSETAQKFWPLYNEFNKKRNDIQIEKRIAMLEMNKSDINNERARELLNKEIESREKETELFKEYLTKFQKVITPVQVMKLMKAERDFNAEIIKRMQRRNQNRKPGNRHP